MCCVHQESGMCSNTLNIEEKKKKMESMQRSIQTSEFIFKYQRIYSLQRFLR